MPVQELDEIMNDHFGNCDPQTQSSNDEAELQGQTRADDVDEEERWPTWLGKTESRDLIVSVPDHCLSFYFISNSLQICWQKFYRNVAWVVLYRI